MKNKLTPGAVAPRPKVGKSQIHSGVHPISSFTHRTQKFQTLPDPLGEPPYHMELEDVISGVKKSKNLVFHTVGDSGGIKHPEYQMAVAGAMKSELSLAEGEKPMFFFHLGDVVYYNGETKEYFSQFYEPYNHYDIPIFSIPGNHDGDPIDDSQTSLDGWVQYFMTREPMIDPISKDAPRVTMCQPNPYFTLNCPFATIIGMYTNVPEHGSIDSVQQQWLTHEFATAPKDKALIVALHHPIYSFDDHHSGSTKMADALQQAINDSKRLPNLVLTAHVHNYQRIEKKINEDVTIPFLVAGHGGYYHLHNITADNGFKDDSNDATLIFGEQKHGFVTISIDENKIVGRNNSVDKETHEVTTSDSFEYSAQSIFIADNEIVDL